jgi:protein phosphatase/serine/threonine-protein phosphatase Stp1
VGSEGDLDLDKVSDRLLPGDRFLLCSDGLCKTLPDGEIAALLATEQPADNLVEAALQHHGRDNITAVAVEILRSASA